MNKENEIIQAIEILFQDYENNTKNLTEVSTAFKEDILAKLSPRKFALIKSNLDSLFQNYQKKGYEDVVSSLNDLIDEYQTPNLTTIANQPSNTKTQTEQTTASVQDVSFYDTDGHKVEQLSLEQLATGRLIENRYQLIKKIGTGGMAVVWKALDKIQDEAQTTDDQRYVAIKFIDAGFDEDMFANTVREANRTRSLKHENIIDILTVGKTGGLLFIVMELLQGKPLKDFIREQVSQSKKSPQKDGFILPYEQALNLTQQLIESIAYAHLSNKHKKGILHLDLKPDNIFYNPENGLIKVLDFGLARYATKEDDEKTTFKGVEGLTKSYASPEALRRYQVEDDSDDRPILEASVEDDVYSLACIIYEIFSGKKPFGSLLATQAEEENKKITPLKLPKNQWQALTNALAFDRQKRSSTVQVLFDDFFKKTEKKTGDSFIAKIAASAFLVGIVAIMGWLLYFKDTSNDAPPIVKTDPIIKTAPKTTSSDNNKSDDVKIQDKTVKKPENTEPSLPPVKVTAPDPTLKFWAVVNNKSKKVLKINKNSETIEKHLKIGDRLTLSFLASEDLHLILVYIDSKLNMMIEPLPKCCKVDEIYEFRDKKPMKISKPTGTDKIRFLVSQHKIKKSWIHLNKDGEIDENYINENLIKESVPEKRYFTNGKLNLIISK